MGEGWKEQTDGFSQLLRRLLLVLMMTNDEIQSMEYNAQSCKFHPVPGAVRENPYQKTGEISRENNINKFCSLFDAGITDCTNIT